ncbi:hypothetical protein [Sansalvadorimonas verongulae]|uniref:hypothetical protein n=1 Tax=Sansalvadorimonas verongulae TaxID=2172824 RepID=UPI0012BD1D46|nr:hypothetical protein [Sansalvadorimonas verongulae]MTI12106.1 hypothetical protein [Sansalvadorimonas verongulae]
MNAALNVKPAAPVKDEVICPKCDHRIWDGEVIRSRCVKLRDGVALCRCKAWVKVPACRAK